MSRVRLITLLLISYPHFSIAQQTEKPAGIAVKPVTVDFAVAPSQSAVQKVIITNALNTKKQFAVYVSDWRRDTVGAHVYTEPSNDPRSCASWLQLSKNFFELNPGETEELLVTITHPTDSSKGKQMNWCMLFIETIQEKTVTDTIGLTTTITNKFRVGVHIYQTPPDISKKEIKLLAFNVLDTSNSRFRITCQNNGETQLQCTSFLELVNVETGEKLKIGPKEFPIFPEQIRYIDFEILNTLQTGKYLITAVIDAGIELPLEAAQLKIEAH